MIGRFSLKALLGFTTCVAILIAIDWFLLAVTVRIHNTGKVAMNDVQIHVSGQTYEIGNIQGLAVNSCRINPADESDVEISYVLPDGSSKRHNVDCYLESGSCGTIEVEIADGVMVKSSDKTRISIL